MSPLSWISIPTSVLSILHMISIPPSYLFYTWVIQFSSVQLIVTTWTAALQASLSITNSWSLLELMSMKPVVPSCHLILCRPLLLLPSIFPSIRVFSDESVLCIGWPKYWEKQIKATMKYHLTLGRMAIIKNLQTINAGDREVMEKREPNWYSSNGS